jgi:outer membrane protein
MLTVSPARAETLFEAMAQAYQNNPTLQAERASVRAADEGVPQAAAGWRPSITATGRIGRSRQDSFFAPAPITVSPKVGSIILNQPLFRGGRTVNSTRQAKNLVKSGRAQLDSTEQTVLLDTVSAYMDVVRDVAVLDLNVNNVQVLRRQLEANQDRFRVGEITRTDVAQSEARLSRAISSRIGAEAQLTASRAAYQKMVGQMPGTLASPPPLPEMPATEDEAHVIARAESPVLKAARFAERSAYYAVKAAKGELLPTVSLEGKYQRTDQTFNKLSSTETKEITAQITVPLYQAGAEYSRIRQRAQEHSRAMARIAEAERQVAEGVANAWEGLRAARAIIESSHSQVRANEIALEGVRQEAFVGSRTTLDVLDAEQELLDSRVELVRAKRNEYVAAYQLLAAIGRLNAKWLALPVKTYEPKQHYDKVKSKWVGWGAARD